MKKQFLALIILIFLAAACGETKGEKPVNKGLAGFSVEFAEDFDLGSPEHSISGYGEDIGTTIDITALGYDKQPLTDYNGEVEVGLLYGSNADVARVSLTNGSAENVKIKMRYCLDNDRVIVEEVTKRDGETAYSKTGKLGVSAVFYPQVATISAIQGTVNGAKGNPSAFNNRNLTLKNKEMVVIAVIEGGFYLHEVGTEEYSSIYMYTYSTPYVDDNMEESTSLPVGALIESANGSVFEFFGFTEMSFPTFKPVYVKRDDGRMMIKVDESLIPEPKNINDILNDNDEMEKYEASLVTVENVSVDWFNENDSSYIEYSQFPLKTEDGKNIMAQTLYTAPLFNALEEKPEGDNVTHKYNFTGILKQHTSARPSTWILVPRDMNDIECIDCNK